MLKKYYKVVHAKAKKVGKLICKFERQYRWRLGNRRQALPVFRAANY